MNSRVTKGYDLKVTGKACYPDTRTLTGTIETVGTRVTGTGTLFQNELKEGPTGDWIYSSVNNELRQVKAIYTQTYLELYEAFTPDLAAATALLAPPIGTYKGIACTNVGAANGVFNEMTITPSDAAITHYNENGLQPICVDGTGTELQISLEK